MALWSEIEIKRDLKIPLRKQKPPNFTKLFKTTPHAEYTAREEQTAIRLRRLMGSNVVALTDMDYMRRLEERMVETYGEDVLERIGQRARRATEIAHLDLWETVLRGQCKLSPNTLHDACMREIREHQVMIEGLQEKAQKLGTSVLRVAAHPKVWVKPSRWRPQTKQKKKKEILTVTSTTNAVTSATKAVTSATKGILGDVRDAPRDSVAASKESAGWRYETKKTRWGTREYRRLGGRLQRLAEVLNCDIDPDYQEAVEEKRQYKDRQESRVMPPRAPPVVFPLVAPSFVILTADAGGKRVMRPFGSMDYIFPKYFRPHAPHQLRECEDLSELYQLSQELFELNYPPMDSTDWLLVMEKREKRRTAYYTVLRSFSNI